MRLPLWIGGSAVLVLSGADALIELQSRAVAWAARALIDTMTPDGVIRAVHASEHAEPQRDIPSPYAKTPRR